MSKVSREAARKRRRRLCEWRGVNGRNGKQTYRKEPDMNKLIHIGFGNMVNTSKIIAIVSPDSAPVKRMVQNAKEKGFAIDATQGRKTKAVLVMENSQIVLSALLPETITGRAQAGTDALTGKEASKQEEEEYDDEA